MTIDLPPNTEIVPYSWFGTKGERVSIYADGTVEIQHGGSAYRAAPYLWIKAAIELNYSVSHCQAGPIDEGQQVTNGTR